MRWQGRRQRQNVEDRRSVGGKAVLGGGGILGIILILVISCVFDVDPRPLMQEMQNVAPQNQAGTAEVDPAEDELAQMVAVVLADTEDVWRQLFQKLGKEYREPTLVLFRQSVQSACGFQSAATGPFYCPSDQHLYIDLSFYDEMEEKLGAPGDFAQAYVIAHEVGHHVQNLLGISDEVHHQRSRADKEQANELSVRLELQADFFAGVWAHHAQRNWKILEPGDLEEALRAATAIGDDRLQMQSRGYVVPESFTHGSSEQRVRWFTRGLKSGDMTDGDTYNIPYSDL
jgi:predicted metalloprotease